MFIKDKTYKLIVIVLLVIFAAGLFFSVRFLRSQINKATSSIQGEENVSTAVNLNAWEKIKHRFTQ